MDFLELLISFCEGAFGAAIGALVSFALVGITGMFGIVLVTAGVAAFFGFCLSTFTLLFLQFGVAIPVTHHITLCAAYGVVASGGNLIWGFAGALTAAFAGDFFGRLFHVHGDAHIDPPAAAIALTSFLLLGLLPRLKIF